MTKVYIAERFFGSFIFIVLFFSIAQYVSSQGVGGANVQIGAVVPGCGNDLVEGGEECDGAVLGGASCQSKGFTSGVLQCTNSCFFNTTSCIYTPPNSGGGAVRTQNGAQVVLTGKAYPRSEVTILKDAQVVATTVADEQANFQVLIKGLAAGTFIFSMYSEDDKGVRSALFTFPVTVTKGILAKIESIFVAPTIVGDKVSVKQGDPIILFGQSYPTAEITIEINSAEKYFVKTNTDTSGMYLEHFDSSVLALGDHHAKARATEAQQISSQSTAYAFAVGTENVYSDVVVSCPKKGDMNGDCRVNLIDFSIVAFWYNRTLSTTFTPREREHLNGDGKVNLVDFSILAFYWTG